VFRLKLITMKIIRIVGIIILMAALIANLQYAFTDYGLLDNMLVKDVLDQTNYAGTLK
jgi:hypothetical protein